MKVPKPRTAIVTIVLPLICAAAYAVLEKNWPNLFEAWLGAFILLGITLGFMCWDEIREYGPRLAETERASKELQRELRETRESIEPLLLASSSGLVPSHAELIREAQRLIANLQRKNAHVYSYSGFSLKLAGAESYFQATIRAIEDDSIERYHRITGIRTAGDIADTVKVARQFCCSEKVRRRTEFRVMLKPAASNISFLIAGEEDCLVALPDLTEGIQELKQHLAGVYVRNSRIVFGLRKIFEDSLGKKSIRIELPECGAAEKEWTEVSERLHKALDATRQRRSRRGKAPPASAGGRPRSS